MTADLGDFQAAVADAVAQETQPSDVALWCHVHTGVQLEVMGTQDNGRVLLACPQPTCISVEVGPGAR